jgi:beta-glucanase (GH16 family)
MRRQSLQHLKSAVLILFVATFALSCQKAAIVNAPPVTKVTNPDTTTTPATDTTTFTNLVWDDEFNGTSVDATKWNFETGSLGVNQEEEYYQASNATVANGNLVITAQQQSVGGFNYTSARMNTINKFNITYGKIEARIKLPMGAGLWPAFWMLGASINTGAIWPQCGEIDIMEHIDADSLIYGTMHWSEGGNATQYGLNIASSPSAYHIYSVEWDQYSIRWYVDNTLYVTGNIANDINSTDAFHKPFFIILNMAVGGSFPGLTVDTSKLPAAMYVDYVRVYSAN